MMTLGGRIISVREGGQAVVLVVLAVALLCGSGAMAVRAGRGELLAREHATNASQTGAVERGLSPGTPVPTAQPPGQPPPEAVEANAGDSGYMLEEAAGVYLTDSAHTTEVTAPHEIEAASIGGTTPVIESITTITENGARLDWSHTLDLIAFDRKEDDGFYDIYAMRPDGSGQTCLTCETPGLPGKHMGNPEWHPSGEYIVFQAEKAEHPGGSSGATPGIGFDNNLWVMTSDGSEAWQLTDLGDRRAVLHPQFSPDGSRLLWTEGLAMKLADFVTDPEPHLENVQKLRPGRIALHEAHGFSPTDDATVIFSGPLESGQPMWGMDVYTFNMTTGELHNLTSTMNQWDEHAHYSPSGQKVAWMSSMDCGCSPGEMGRLKTDLWIMDADGSNKMRLTRFSDPGSPDYEGRKVVVGDMAWSADGKRLAARLFVGYRQHVVIVEFTSPQ